MHEAGTNYLEIFTMYVTIKMLIFFSDTACMHIHKILIMYCMHR